MDNRKGTQDPGQTANHPTDKGEDSEDRREAAERAWKDRAGVPRGTPEQGDRSADRVGGSGTTAPEPEIEDESDQSATKEAPTKGEPTPKKQA
jgi:hypothetical protein